MEEVKARYFFTAVLGLAAVTLMGAQETKAADSKKTFAMFTAMREVCAVLVPAERNFFLDSVFMFELVSRQELDTIKAESDFTELVAKFKEELQKPETGFEARDCEGLASGEGVMQLVSPMTAKPLKR
jgi:hypothetical protein